MHIWEVIVGTFEKKRDIYFALCATLISALLLCKALGYSTDSAIFPIFLTCLMLFLAVLLLIKSILAKVTHDNSQQEHISQGALLRCALGVLGSTAIYIAGIMYVGYFVSTAIFFLSVMLLYGKNELVPSLAATAIFLLTIYGLFVYFLGINLPQSLLF